MSSNYQLKFIRAPKGLHVAKNTKLKVKKSYVTDSESPYGANLKCYDLEQGYTVIIGETGGFIWLKDNKEARNNSTTTKNNPVNKLSPFYNKPRIEYIKAPMGLEVPEGTIMYVLNTTITDSECPYGEKLLCYDLEYGYSVIFIEEGNYIWVRDEKKKDIRKTNVDKNKKLIECDI